MFTATIVVPNKKCSGHAKYVKLQSSPTLEKINIGKEKKNENIYIYIYVCKKNFSWIYY